MDLSKYLELYLSEGREHVSLLRRGLPLEGPVSVDAVTDLFRHAHSLKGMAASMGFELTSRLSHDLEALLDHWRKGAEATPQQRAAALDAVDVLDACMDAVERQSSDGAMAPRVEASVAGLGAASVSPEAGLPSAGPTGTEASKAAATVEGPGRPVTGSPPPAPVPRARIKVSIDPSCPLPAARFMVMAERVKAEEPSAVLEPDLQHIVKEGLRSAVFLVPPGPLLKDLALSLRSLPDVADVDLEQASAPPLRSGTEGTLVQSMRVSPEDLDALREQASDLLYHLNQFEAALGPEEKRRHHFWLESERVHLNRLFDRVLSMRLVSFEVLAERLGRTTRELSSRLGKAASLTVSGAEERVDRGLLERLLDPLNHLVRNAMDHGLEGPEERRREGKTESGRLTLDIRRESEALLISFADDGRGIDVEAIRQAAVDRGLFAPHEVALLDHSKLLDLLTAPAFSTRKEVTDVSGRGVGLDVVRSAVESLGGHLEMASEKGRGSRFTLVIPSATTLTRVLVFGWDDEVRYGIPASQIQHIYPLSSAPLVWSGTRRFLQAGEELLPVLEWRAGPVGRDGAGLRLVHPQGDRVLLVSRVYQGERVVIMPWGAPLEMVSEWMGGALLATGEIAYVLDGRVLIRREGD